MHICVHLLHWQSWVQICVCDIPFLAESLNDATWKCPTNKNGGNKGSSPLQPQSGVFQRGRGGEDSVTLEDHNTSA
jgi:hypothetical protein